MAAKLSKYPLRGANTKELVLLAGSFTPDTNTTYPHNVAVNTRTNGAQFTVTKTAAGTYTITSTDSFSSATCLNADVQIVGQKVLPAGAATQALAVTCSQFGYPAANQWQVRLYNPATNLSASDITAVEPSSVPTGCAIQFLMVLRVTNAPD